MGLEYPFHPFSVGYLAYGEGGVEATVSLADDHAFIGLQALPTAFLDPDLNDDGIAGAELGNIRPELFLLDFLDES